MFERAKTVSTVPGRRRSSLRSNHATGFTGGHALTGRKTPSMRTRFPQSLNNFAANPLLLVIAVWKDSTRSLGFRDWPDAPVAMHARSGERRLGKKCIY